jgi:hypothetical protein
LTREAEKNTELTGSVFFGVFLPASGLPLPVVFSVDIKKAGAEHRLSKDGGGSWIRTSEG